MQRYSCEYLEVLKRFRGGAVQHPLQKVGVAEGGRCRGAGEEVQDQTRYKGAECRVAEELQCRI
jgi:hypothetical protein